MNVDVKHFIRENYIRKKMNEHEAEFTERRNISVFVGTWNVNGKKPGENLAPWLRAGKGTTGGKRPEIYVVGFQEMVELNTQSVLLNSAMPGIEARSKQWQANIESVVNKGVPEDAPDRLELVKGGYLVGVMVCVFASKRLRRSISEVAMQTAGVGFGGFMGNKGGVAIRFRAFDSTFCFVCAHLAAHRDKVAERNNDFANLSRKIIFEVYHSNAQQTAAFARGGRNDRDEESSSQLQPQAQFVNIMPGHDVVVWLGDFNYRIDSSISVEETHRRCDKKDIRFLLDHDQLNEERKQGRTFQEFEEGPITFMPTYKYQPRTNKYERRPEKKMRAPAWCDRVLWYASRKADVRQLAYDKADLLTSDHKPVLAVFEMQAKRVIEVKKARVMERITHKLDKWENEQLPKVELSESTLNFGRVLYEDRVVRELEIHNVGTTVAAFRFVPKLEEKQFCKPWMTIHPKFGMLTPGEKAKIHVAVHVDYRTARYFANRRETIEDILILRLESGRDYFISIGGRFAPSSFGMSLEELSGRHDPVRPSEQGEDDVSGGKIDEDEKSSGKDAKAKKRLHLPKELWRLCDLLFSKNLLDTRGLFIKSGDPSEMDDLRHALDTGTNFLPCSPHSAVAVLFEFLHSLSTPILAPALFSSPDSDSVEFSKLAKWCDEILSRVKPLQYNVFVYLLLFFKEALSHREKNELQIDILIRIITPRLIWNEREDLVDPTTVKRYRAQAAVFLKFLFTQDYF